LQGYIRAIKVEKKQLMGRGMNIRATIFVAAFFCVGGGSLSAQIYRSVDAEGNVVFTDAPAADSSPVELAPASTYTPPEYTSTPDENPGSSSVPAQAFYSSIKIVQPAAEETVRDNAGNIAVRIELEPELLDEAGHRVQFFLDGEPIGEPSSGPITNLANVDRGDHQVEAAVIDVTGKEILRSSPVRFFLQRYSILNAPNKPVPAPRR